MSANKCIGLFCMLFLTWLSIYPQSSTTYIMNVLKNGSIIYQQRTDCIDSISFTLPPQFQLLTPRNADTGVYIPLTFSWAPYPSAQSYNFQVSDNSSFSNLIYSITGITGTTTILNSLSTSTKYYWRIQAVTTTYNSDWSFSSTFKTSFNKCGTPSIDYAGQIYHTVQIGEQCWLKENLNVGTQITNNSPSNNNIIEKYCYNNDPQNCIKYGGLYIWDEAMQYNNVTGSQGICPTGWHIPTIDDYNKLNTTINADGNTLKAVGQGRGNGVGTDASGFSAYLTGYRFNDGVFAYQGEYAMFVTSNQANSSDAYYMFLQAANNYWGLNYTSNNGSKYAGFSLRCIKN